MTLRAVVDPNVFISAQISSLGHPARIARATDKGIFELVVQYSPPRRFSEMLEESDR